MATVSPTITYAIVKRGEKSKSRQMLEVNEMKALRKIVGEKKIDKIICQQIRVTDGI